MSETLRIMTWNVWFSELARDQRMQELLTYIEELQPDVVGLQELTRYGMDVLGGPNSILSQAYQPTPSDASEIQGYWERIYTKLPIGPRSIRTEYEWTHMGRGLSVLHSPDLDLVVGATHLESMDSAETRQAQASEAFERLDSFGTRNVVFMGDMNLYDEETLEPLPTGWVDAWDCLYPHDPGYTRDNKVNAMIGYPTQQRIDRIFVRSQDYKLQEMELLGLAPLDPKQYDLKTEEPIHPSDHFGLFLQLKPKAK